MFIEKKNGSGTILWTQTYNGAGNGNDYAADVQITSGGSVYVCGTYYKNSTDSNNAIIIKYNNSGTQQWAYTYNGAGSRHDMFAAIQVGGNAIVGVGSTYKGSANLYDMLAIRIDSSGNNVWTQTWDYTNLNDGAVNLWNSGTKIYIAGGAQSATTTYKYAVVNVKASDGSIQGSTVTGGTAFGFDQLTDIQYDANGYIYLTGGVINTGTVYDIKTVKLDTALNIIWSATYASSGAYNDVGTGLAIDQVGNVIVTGYRTSGTTGKDFVTIKYSSGGTQRWVSTYDGGINADDSATSIVVSPTDTNRIFVTGFSFNGTSKDYKTMKYDGLGNLKWEISFNNVNNTDDRATAIALDDQGNIIVAGQNRLAWNSHQYTTVKYVEKRIAAHQDTISYTSSSFVFTKNNGQVYGTDSATHPEVKYYVTKSSPAVYFLDTAVSFVYAALDTSTNQYDTLTRVDMKFVSANASRKVYSMEERDEFSNYYLSHIPDGRTGVPNYNELVLPNVWDSVDVIYGSNMIGLKQYFICKPMGGGSSVSQVEMLFAGADSVHIGTSGELMVYTKKGIITFRKAIVWQLDASGNFSGLAWQPSYQKVGTCGVKFTSLGSFNSAYPLVIAMDRGPNPTFSHLTTPEWSMYLGGNAFDQGTGVAVDADGSPYFVGYTASTNFPVFLGMQPLPGGVGTFDAYISRFGSADNASQAVDPDADKQIWTTYFGGSGLEKATGVDATGSSAGGRVYITGFTESSDFPTFSNSGNYNQQTLQGTRDAFIIGLDNQYGGAVPNNTTVWATFFGGNGDEVSNAVTIDIGNGDIFIVGSTTTSAYSSTSCGVPGDNGLPTCNALNSYDNSGSYGGNIDGLIAQFTSTGTLIWSTYFGGNREDVVTDITANSGDIHITGYTEGGTFPILPRTGAYNQGTHGGATYDAFVGYFKSNAYNWCTYFGGDGNDAGFAIKVDESGATIIAGETESQTSACAPSCLCDVPATGEFPMCDNNGAFFQGSGGVGAFGGGTSDAYIAKFTSTCVLDWSTYYGGDGDESIKDLDVDYMNNIYYTGQTSTASPSGAIDQFGTNGWDYYQGFLNGNTDAFLGYFNTNNQRVWSDWYSNPIESTYDEAGTGIAAYVTGQYVHFWYMTGLTNTPNDQQNFPGYQFNMVAFFNPGECCPNAYIQYTAGAPQDAIVTRFSANPMWMTVEDNGTDSTISASVFPNPMSNFVTVQMALEQPTDVAIMIYTIDGQLVYEQKYGQQVDQFNAQIDFSTFASGIYILNIQTEEGCASKKLVKQ